MGWSHHDNDIPFLFHDNHNVDWLLWDTTTPAQLNTLKQSIENCSAIAVSDGSFMESHKAGLTGWIIEDINQTQQLRWDDLIDKNKQIGSQEMKDDLIVYHDF